MRRFFRGRAAAGDPAYAPPRVEGGPRRLTEQELAHLYHHGYVIVPGVVARHQAEAALRSINRSLGATGRVGGEQGECCKELKNAPEILALFRASAAKKIVAGLLGPTYPVGGAQIALRFPGDGCGPNFQVGPHWARHWHIDGLAAAGNPYTPVGEIHNFNALVGIVLQDVDSPLAGNLTVHPGSHWALEKHWRTHGFTSVLNLGVQGLPTAEAAGFPQGPVMVTAKQGDMVIVNYNVAHSVAPNLSSAIRYQVYFRVTSRNHARPFKEHRPASMLNVWDDWVGLRETIEVQRALQLSEQQQQPADVISLSSSSAATDDEDLRRALERSLHER